MENTLEQELNLNTISSLIAEIHNAATNYLETRLKEEGLVGIAASHGFILFVLSQNKNEETGELESMSMKKIAKRIGKNKSTTTVLMNKLERQGYVTRKKDSSDERFFYISLSEKGRSFTDKMQKISKELSEKFYNDFSEDEKKTVFTLLKKIQSNFN